MAKEAMLRRTSLTRSKLRGSPLLGPTFALLLSLLPLPFAAGVLPTVRFVGEDIAIHVSPQEVGVEGRYVYRNPFPFPVVQGFSIPLPVDSTHSPPVGISATRLFPTERPISLRHLLGKLRFEIAFGAREEVIVAVHYRQHTAEPNARYFLTTTRPWRRPLAHGSYRLFPEGVKITGSNYPLGTEIQGALAFTREQFMPSEDWHFSWEVERQ